jgi:hypothetical protein
MSKSTQTNRSAEDAKRLDLNLGAGLSKVAAATKFAPLNGPSWAKRNGEGTRDRRDQAGVVTPAQFAQALGYSLTTFFSCGIIPQPDVSAAPKLWRVETVNKFLSVMGKAPLPVQAAAAPAARKPPESATMLALVTVPTGAGHMASKPPASATARSLNYPQPFLTAAEAAREFGMSKSEFLAAVDEGRLPAPDAINQATNECKWHRGILDLVAQK